MVLSLFSPTRGTLKKDTPTHILQERPVDSHVELGSVTRVYGTSSSIEELRPPFGRSARLDPTGES